jgi:hypothetical protein
MIRSRVVGLVFAACAVVVAGCSAGADESTRRPRTQSNTAFWTGPFACATAAPSGYHFAGQPCQQCHVPMKQGSAFPFVIGGTVYQADGDAGAPNIEVAVRDGTTLFRTCSTRNGNFWIDGTGTIDWTTATIRVRNDAGVEKSPTTTAARNDDCNGCHTATARLLAP